MSFREQFPPFPSFSEDQIEHCRRTADAMPVVFESYKYVVLVTKCTASIDPSSAACRALDPIEYAVLVGLLNRISRLILSTLKLGHGGKYGETVRLLGRCINESAVKVRWLSECKKDDRFRRYLADGLKKDLKLKTLILDNIARRGGKQLEIEKRMLGSINNCVGASGLTEGEIRKTPALPDLRSMYTDLGLSDQRYLATQGLGSHEVHGTWTDLMCHYLERDDSGRLVLQDHQSRPHENQFVRSSLMILDALQTFVAYISVDTEAVSESSEFYEDIRQQILWAARLGHGSDFSVVE